MAHKCAAGGFAGWNEGTITGGRMAASLGNRETGYTYLGGVAGVNLGGDAAASTRKGLIICTENNNTGTVEANQYAGGVAGTNRAEITRVENRASVRASTKYAGGIAGVNDAGGKISACVHTQNQVYATNGEAGGIAGNNNKDALIENVQVKADVTAANGTAGGVTATNFGIIGQETGLENNSSVSGCTITGTSESIGAVAAYNRAGATIRNVKLAENANVQFSTCLLYTSPSPRDCS